MTLLAILGVLALALVLIVPLIERHAPPTSAETQQRISRWILPLVAVALVLGLLRQCGTV